MSGYRDEDGEWEPVEIDQDILAVVFVGIVAAIVIAGVVFGIETVALTLAWSGGIGLVLGVFLCLWAAFRQR